MYFKNTERLEQINKELKPSSLFDSCFIVVILILILFGLTYS